MSNGIKWKRIRPGLYELHVDGVIWAEVERGGETGRWWWWTWPNEESQYGCKSTLKNAKAAVMHAMDNA